MLSRFVRRMSMSSMWLSTSPNLPSNFPLISFRRLSKFTMVVLIGWTSWRMMAAIS